MTKLLIGTEHMKKEELEAVIEEIRLHSPSSIGLELPEDYLKKEKYNIITAFSGDLAIEFKKVEIIPLEQPDLFHYCQSLMMAKAVREGKLKEEDIAAELKRMERHVNPYAPPEMYIPASYIIIKNEKAIEILKDNKTLEEVMGLWRDSVKKREEHMLKVIKKRGPEVVVIGDSHALNFREKLPKYKYKKFY